MEPLGYGGPKPNSSISLFIGAAGADGIKPPNSLISGFAPLLPPKIPSSPTSKPPDCARLTNFCLS